MVNCLMFGGAFNPPTKAHIELAKTALDQSGADFVIFVPTKMSYIQDDQQKSYAFTDKERLQMLRKIQKNHPWMKVSSFEINAKTQPRTYETLCHLRKQGYQCRLLFGSDKLLELETGWRYVEEISKEFGFALMKRNEDDVEKIFKTNAYLKNLKDSFLLINTPDIYQNVSSTKIRNALAQIKQIQETIRQDVPEELFGMLQLED